MSAIVVKTGRVAHGVRLFKPTGNPPRPPPLRAQSLRSQVLGSMLKDARAGPMVLVARNFAIRAQSRSKPQEFRSKMSIAPPGYPTDETDPGPGNLQADDTAQYEFKSVQALRGRAGSAKAKWQNQGWELVSENPGPLRTELNFRRVKPKTVGAYLLGFVATFRRLQPKTQLALVASAALILVAGITGIVIGTQNGGDTPNPSAAQTTASTAPPADLAVTDITVDELLDKLNSANMGGVKNGDQFRVTGELSGSDYWGVGASGDFSVALKAKGGANDLNVFVDESDASGWQDGTKVEMVLKAVPATIRGETTDGWLEVQSAKTISGGTTN